MPFLCVSRPTGSRLCRGHQARRGRSRPASPTIGTRAVADCTCCESPARTLAGPTPTIPVLPDCFRGRLRFRRLALRGARATGDGVPADAHAGRDAGPRARRGSSTRATSRTRSRPASVPAAASQRTFLQTLRSSAPRRGAVRRYLVAVQCSTCCLRFRAIGAATVTRSPLSAFRYTCTTRRGRFVSVRFASFLAPPSPVARDNTHGLRRSALAL